MFLALLPPHSIGGSLPFRVRLRSSLIVWRDGVNIIWRPPSIAASTSINGDISDQKRAKRASMMKEEGGREQLEERTLLRLRSGFCP